LNISLISKWLLMLFSSSAAAFIQWVAEGFAAKFAHFSTDIKIAHLERVFLFFFRKKCPELFY